MHNYSLNLICTTQCIRLRLSATENVLQKKGHVKIKIVGGNKASVCKSYIFARRVVLKVARSDVFSSLFTVQRVLGAEVEVDF